MTETEYPKPEGLDADALQDAARDLLDNGAATLHPDQDPEKWIYWLKRYWGFYEVIVTSHDSVALILEGF